MFGCCWSCDISEVSPGLRVRDERRVPTRAWTLWGMAHAWTARLLQRHGEGRSSGPPRAHAEAGNPTRAWPKADPAVTRSTLVAGWGRGNAVSRPSPGGI
ncbi:hypothetical protein GCM10018775_19120 [Streptomyces umbrinus]|nr:hypothetical protein GCM10018775_19120 [Streptomyces umbrinus]